MKNLSLEQLHELRIAVLENTLSLQKEAELLFKHACLARAYLLAHFVTEEVGKLVILAGACNRLRKGQDVNWERITKRFLSHRDKVGANDVHHAIAGLDSVLTGDQRIAWLKDASSSRSKRVTLKNIATYVDADGTGIQKPCDNISRDMALDMLDTSAKSLAGHFQRECAVNPILRAALLQMSDANNEALSE